MSMVGQSESDDDFVSGMKAKELMATGSSIMLFLFQWKNKNVDLFTIGSLIFGIQNKIINKQYSVEKKETYLALSWYVICCKLQKYNDIINGQIT